MSVTRAAWCAWCEVVRGLRGRGFLVSIGFTSVWHRAKKAVVRKYIECHHNIYHFIHHSCVLRRLVSRVSSSCVVPNPLVLVSICPLFSLGVHLLFLILVLLLPVVEISSKLSVV